ncbi:MAG TPA: metalloregulator ArsR/SmtB family transcription factor [Devosiaceae bacterium]|nr:metalloregulator ArsR/SmtB family transcription factor [Devosiaceae bacterium]
MPNLESRLNDTFRSLSDPTRRAVVERLGRGPATVSELARPFAMALPSFLQHLRTLEDCGLISSRKTGRVRTCELAPQTLAAMENWLIRQRLVWERRLDQLDEMLIDIHRRTPRP